MSFYFKKLISIFIYPLPLSLLLLLIGLIACASCRRRKIGAILGFLGVAILMLFSMQSFSYFLINQLQSEYQPLLQAPAVTKIVVLGGGGAGNKAYPANLSLGSSSLSRLIEGIRLFHLLKAQGQQPVLILSGGRVFQSRPAAGLMQNTALMLGIPNNDIQIEDGSRDTFEEAKFLKPILKDQPFILVTSAYHMPRAMALFQSQDMHPIAAPTQFYSPSHFEIRMHAPSAFGLEISDIAIHEYVGMLWEKWNHQIK